MKKRRCLLQLRPPATPCAQVGDKGPDDPGDSTLQLSQQAVPQPVLPVAVCGVMPCDSEASSHRGVRKEIFTVAPSTCELGSLQSAITTSMSDDAASMRALRGDVLSQVRLLAKMGYSEPYVVAARHLDKLASLQRARVEWISNGGKPEVAQQAGSLSDWNSRDPLSDKCLEAARVPISQAAMFGANVIFAALPRSSAAPTVPLSESTPRITRALASYVESLVLSADGRSDFDNFFAQGASPPHFLIPSLAGGPRSSQASVAAAMHLYTQCCSSVVTFGGLPDIDKDAVRGLDIVDFEPVLRDREKAQAAAEGGLGTATDAEVSARCERVWEAAERLAADFLPKRLPRFRALAVADDEVQLHAEHSEQKRSELSRDEHPALSGAPGLNQDLASTFRPEVATEDDQAAAASTTISTIRVKKRKVSLLFAVG